MADKIQYFAVNSARWLSLEDFEGEVWKDLPDFEGSYMVSNMGRIKGKNRSYVMKHSSGCSVVHVRGRIIKTKIANNGYLLYKLSKSNKVYTLYGHRLVATAFIPNINGYKCVNHINERKDDNRASNLEWCTHKYNNNYGTKRQRMSAMRRGVERLSRRAIILCYKIDPSILRKQADVKQVIITDSIAEEIGKKLKLMGFDPKRIKHVPYKNAKASGHKTFNKYLESGLIQFWRVLPGEQIAADIMGIPQGSINAVVNGRRFCAGGFTFKKYKL